MSGTATARRVCGSIYERERPQSLSDIAGHADVVARLEQLDEMLGFRGQVFWLSAPSGCGKTTIARIIASRVADPNCIFEVDAQDVSMELLREWEDKCQYTCLFSEGWAFIVNEAHCLHTKAVSRLQTLLEDQNVQRNGTFIFTTTDKGQQHLFDTKFDALPFLSRSIILEMALTDADYQAMAQRVVEIGGRYKLPVSFDRAYQFMRNTGNMRAALQALVSGSL